MAKPCKLYGQRKTRQSTADNRYIKINGVRWIGLNIRFIDLINNLGNKIIFYKLLETEKPIASLYYNCQARPAEINDSNLFL
jgi:hypothetical protein